MRRLMSMVLYTGLALCANAAAAGADLEALRTGEMRRLNISAPAVLPDVALGRADGGEARLSDYRGKVVVLNFWATWCQPCKDEMPALDRLEAELGGAEVAVVPVATGRNAPSAIARFFADTGVRHLETLLDPRQELAGALGVTGLPATILLDREGRERARLVGPAAWDGPEAKAVIAALRAE